MTARQGGFTLLELLVAMAIFALLATAGYTALQQGIEIQERLQDKRAFWRRLDSVLALMEGDLAHARELAPRASSGQQAVPFRGKPDADSGREGQLFRFTRGGHTSFREGPVAPHLRIAYRFRDGTLFRVAWPRLGRPSRGRDRETRLLGELETIRIRYLGPDAQWQSTWPPPTSSSQEAPDLPRVAEVTLTFSEHGTIRRLFHVGPPS